MAPRIYHSNPRREQDLAGYRSREQRAGHEDYRDRAVLLANIVEEVNLREMFWDDAHRVAGVPVGSLNGSSLTTERLRQVLEILQALPDDPGPGPFRFALRAVPGWDAPNLAALFGGPSPGP